MSDLRELYQEVILDHYRRPRNFGRLDEPNRVAEGDNPLCGDQIHLFLKVDDGRIVDVAFEGQGCAISTASASVMTDAIRGKTVEEVRRLFDKMMQMLTGDPTEQAAPDSSLGKLAVFAGVREYPVRVKCATLAWHTLVAALEGDGASVSTE